jgi:flagellar FliL protein
LSEAVAAPDAEEDLPVRRPIPVLLVAAAGGALIIGAAAGFGAALLVNILTAEPPPPPPPEPKVAPLALEALSVNLRGTGGQRVLTIQVGLEVSTIDPEALKVWSPILRDSILVLASDYTADEMLLASGRERFRRELHHRMDLILHEELRDLYVTEIVVQ